MKLWIDDVRPAPEGYVWRKSVNDAINIICQTETEPYYFKTYGEIEVIDMDHDSGEFAKYGGDYVKLLDWLEKTGRNYPIHIHSMNPVGVQNMRAIIQKNHWKEV